MRETLTLLVTYCSFLCSAICPLRVSAFRTMKEKGKPVDKALPSIEAMCYVCNIADRLTGKDDGASLFIVLLQKGG